MHTFWKRLSLTLVAFLLCLIILFVPVGVMLAGYGLSLENLRQQLIHSQAVTLQRVRDAADAMLDEMFRQMAAFADTSETRNLMRYPSQPTAERARTLAAYQRKVTGLEQLLPMPCSPIAYFENSGLIVNAAGVVKQDAFSWYAESLSMTEQELYSLLEAKSYQGVLAAAQGRAGCRLALYLRLYDVSARKATGTLLVLIPYEKFIDAVEAKVINPAGELYLENAQGPLLGSLSEPDEMGKWQSNTLASRRYPLTYCYRMDQTQAFAPLRAQQKAQLALLAIALLFGLALILIIVQKARRQVRALMRMLSPEAEDSKRLELGKIAESIERVNTEREEMLLLRTKNEHMARKRLMLTALREEHVVVDDWEQMLNERGLNAKDVYCVAVLRFPPELEKNVETLLTAYVEPMQGVVVSLEGQGVLLLPRTYEQVRPQLETLAGQMPASSICCISRTACPLAALADAYACADDRLRYDAFWGMTPTPLQVFDLKPPIDGSPRGGDLALLSSKLINAIGAGEYGQAREWLENSLEGLLGRTVDTLDMDMCLLRGITALIAQALTQHTPAGDREVIVHLNVEQRLLRREMTFAEMRMELQSLFDALTYCQQNRKAVLPPYIAQVYAEIEKSYADQDFSISQLAESCGYNASYLSHYFKKHTGTGILDCLHQYRIARAQKLLKCGLSVREVAEKTGYTDSRSLIRAFKRYVGITPGQYGKES